MGACGDAMLKRRSERTAFVSKGARVAGLLLVAGACGGEEPMTAPGTISELTPISSIPIPPNYGVHDMFVRDGIAFVSAWNTGLELYDVGDGAAGGSPEAPVRISSIVPTGGAVGGARTHNAWWFHNPATGARRYVFVGQEGPGAIGSRSSGDLSVIDVSDLRSPAQVAFFHVDDAGTHNFWMDEPAATLYMAYYNAGVIGLDVSGDLAGDLAGREIFRAAPGGADTYVWGVMLHRGRLYATDMVDGLYRLAADGATTPAPTLGAVDERFTSDLWLHGDWAFTGTWGNRLQRGNAVKVWRIDGSVPSLAGTLTFPDIGTVGDVEVSRDGRLLLVAAENGVNAGLHLVDVRVPDAPVAVARHTLLEGVHTATFGYVGDRVLIFAAKNPPSPAVVVYDVSEQ